MTDIPDIDDEGPRDFTHAMCHEVFERLEQIGDASFARIIFKHAFWFDYNGKHPPVVPESASAWLVARLEGARMMLDALIETGSFKAR